MAKQLGNFELVIRGTKEKPTEVFRRYAVQDSTDADLKKQKDMKVDEPDFNKVCHNEGTVGELWKDQVDAAETAEGIA